MNLKEVTGTIYTDDGELIHFRVTSAGLAQQWGPPSSVLGETVDFVTSLRDDLMDSNTWAGES